jgi:nitric oxide reductase NorD protein
MAKSGRQSSARFGGRGVRELQTRIEIIVDRVMHSRRSVIEPAKALAQFNLVEQERFLVSVDLIAETSAELAYNFCHFAVPALRLIDEEHWQRWIDRLLETYGKGGAMPAIAAMQGAEAYALSLAQAPQEVMFDEVARRLEAMLAGWGGRTLKLNNAESAYTDTETVFLPVRLNVFPSREENLAHFKSLAAHLWAQTYYGTWQVDVAAIAARYPDPERAKNLFHFLETLRLDACIARDLPGLSRTMTALRKSIPSHELWQKAHQRLREPGASAEDSVRLLDELWPIALDADPAPYQGVLRPEQTASTMARRTAGERKALRQMLARLALERDGQTRQALQMRISRAVDPDQPRTVRFRLDVNGEPVPPSSELNELLNSIDQDFGEIPSEYLEPAGQGDYSALDAASSAAHVRQSSTPGVFVYDEWDHARKKYRKEWCQLREQDVPPADDDFVRNTLAKHRGLLKRLKSAFEALRESDRRLRRQPDGDDIDLDAAIEAQSDIAAGREGGEHLFVANRKTERNIAVMFMVDMSGSTAGWINEVERESLVLLCESLEVLGDRYGIYGFSGHTHTGCFVYRIKRFEEAYDARVRQRIAGIAPQGYTRMGVSIRHLSSALRGVEARTKLLITLSDGRPDDQDGYRGQYGIEDTRKALVEAKYHGVHPYCITIDNRAREYLPHMYGPVNFTLVDRVEKLPFNVSDIYRRLTR